MINPEIVGYIRTEIQKGTDKQAITNSLLANSWNSQDIEEAFNSINSASVTIITKPNIWTTGIPKINKIFGVIFLLLVFGLDLFIVISNPDLAPFWYMMLGVFAVFALFYYLENYIFRKDFVNSPASSLNKIISIVIVIRNLIFLLNFIPFIQLLGLIIIMYVGWIIAIVYIFLISEKYRRIKKTIQP